MLRPHPDRPELYTCREHPELCAGGAFAAAHLKEHHPDLARIAERTAMEIVRSGALGHTPRNN